MHLNHKMHVSMQKSFISSLAATNFGIIKLKALNFCPLCFFLQEKDKISKKKLLETLIKVITNVVRLHRRVKKRFSFELIRHDLPLIFEFFQAILGVYVFMVMLKYFKRDFHLITLIVCVSKHMLCKILMKILSSRSLCSSED